MSSVPQRILISMISTNIIFYYFYNLYGNVKKNPYRHNVIRKTLVGSHRGILSNLPYGIVPVYFKWLQSIH